MKLTILPKRLLARPVWQSLTLPVVTSSFRSSTSSTSTNSTTSTSAFGSSGSTSTVSNDRPSTKLLNVPTGQWSKHDWSQARYLVRNEPEQGTTAWALMDRLIQESHQEQATVLALSELIIRWYQSPNGTNAETLFHKLQHYHHSLGYTPDPRMYSMVLTRASSHAIPLLHIMMDQGPLPDAHMCHVALPFMTPTEADTFFETMKSAGVIPTTATYTHMIRLWLKSTLPIAMERVEELLSECPSTELCLSSLEEVDATTGARLVQQMEQWSEQGKIKITAATYGTLIQAYLKEGKLEEADSTLRKYTNRLDLKPHPNHFYALITRWCQLDGSKNIQRAEWLLDRLIALAHERHDPTLQPQFRAFAQVLSSLTRTATGNADDGPLAERWLQRMWESYRAGGPAKPSTYIYNSVLLCYSKARSSAFHAGKAEQILHEMYQLGDRDIAPDTTSYNAVLEGYSKSRSSVGPERAQALLDSMIQNSQSQTGTNAKPDNFSFNIMIGMWAKSGREDAAIMAEKVLAQLKEFAVPGKLAPDEVTFSSLLTAYGRTNNAQKANDLFNTLCDDYISGKSKLKPRVRDCNIVLSGWTASDQQDSVEQAMKVCQRAMTLKETFGWDPEVHFYTLMISILAKSDDPNAFDHARKILTEMKASPDINAHPNLVTYTAFLNCIAKSQRNDKAVQALQVLIELDQCSMLPDIHVLNGVLRVCAESNSLSQTDRKASFKVALSTFHRCCKQFRPTKQTFIAFFDAAAGLKHDTHVLAAYKVCVELGFHTDPDIRKSTEDQFLHLNFASFS